MDVIYHMGIRHWEDHYLRPSGPCGGRLRSVDRTVLGTGHSGEVANGEVRRTDLRSRALHEDARPISVDTVAGGVCAYSAELVHDIGFLEEAFSPFGYEDAEFAIRARRHGYDNFVLPSEILLHDLASRNKARDHGVVLVGLGKARALIARKQADDSCLPVWVAESLINGLLQVGFAIESRAEVDVASPTELVSGVLRYLAGFLAGAFRPLSSGVSSGFWMEAEGVSGPGEMQTNSGRLLYDRIVCRTATLDDCNPAGPPVDLDLDVEGLAVGIGGAGPLSGLPQTVKGSAGITYTFDTVKRRFEVSRLVLDAPGLFRMEIAGALIGVGPGEPMPELSVDGVGIEYLTATVHDRGLVSRTESTLAWGQDLVGNGVLRSLAPGGNRIWLRRCTTGLPGREVLSPSFGDLKHPSLWGGSVRSHPAAAPGRHDELDCEIQPSGGNVSTLLAAYFHGGFGSMYYLNRIRRLLSHIRSIRGLAIASSVLLALGGTFLSGAAEVVAVTLPAILAAGASLWLSSVRISDQRADIRSLAKKIQDLKLLGSELVATPPPAARVATARFGPSTANKRLRSLERAWVRVAHARQQLIEVAGAASEQPAPIDRAPVSGPLVSIALYVSNQSSLLRECFGVHPAAAIDLVGMSHCRRRIG